MKAILVLDEMPSSCDKCRFHLNYPKVMHYCYIKQEAFDEDKPDWCPLKPMPKKKPTIGKESDNDILCMNAGYNACIDEILGDKE